MDNIEKVTYSDAFTDTGSLQSLKDLLQSEKLCYDDLEDISGILQLARSDNGDLIGGYGLEIFGKDALLRSVVVNKIFKATGKGIEIVNEAITMAKSRKVNHLYLLTTTADKFFLKFGFKVIPRNSVPESIANTNEFKTFCPDTAVSMMCDVDV